MSRFITWQIILVFQVFYGFSQKQTGYILYSDLQKQEICFSVNSKIDSISVQTRFSQYLSELHQNGYLEARIDSICYRHSDYKAYAFKGFQYKWKTLNIDSLSSLWIAKAGIDLKKILSSSISPTDIEKVTSALIHFLNQNGHPFSSIYFKNTTFEGQMVSSTLGINPGPITLLDTLYIKGNAPVSYRFISSYLNFKRGKLYNETAVKNYDRKIKSLGFIGILRQTEVEFIPGRARIYTYLTNQPSNLFSGLLAFSSEQGQRVKLNLTGDLNLLLINTFRQGERNSLQWQALGNDAQKLNFESNWPFLLESNIKVNGFFNLYRRDSTQISINPKLNISFNYSNSLNIGLGVDHRRNTITKNLESESSVSTLYKIIAGIGEKSDHFSDKKHTEVVAEIGVGSRNTVKSEKSTLYELRLNIHKYSPIYSKSIVLYTNVQAGFLGFVESNISYSNFSNLELFKLGGFNSIRGFDNESIIAPKYTFISNELQYKTGNAINIYLFYDLLGYAKTKPLFASGYGLGLQLKTRGGILSIEYAIGHKSNEKPMLKNAKIHIGYKMKF